VRDASAAGSRILLQNIVVLSVGEALTVDQDNRAVRMQNLTVAVTPEEGLLLALAKQVGSFYLALRHPSDDHDVGTALTTTHDLLGNGAKPPPRRSDSVEQRPAPAPGRRVLVIQGARETYQTVE
jgi:pilus assembly protein CpaB